MALNPNGPLSRLLAKEKLRDHGVLDQEEIIEIYERKKGEKTTGVLELRAKEVELQEPEGAYVDFIEATYIVPKITKKIIDDLEKACQDVDCVYILSNVVDQKTKEKGLHRMIKIPISALTERETYDTLGKLNSVLDFPNY
jgi:hypothetical protein